MLSNVISKVHDFIWKPVKVKNSNSEESQDMPENSDNIISACNGLEMYASKERKTVSTITKHVIDNGSCNKTNDIFQVFENMNKSVLRTTSDIDGLKMLLDNTKLAISKVSSNNISLEFENMISNKTEISLEQAQDKVNNGTIVSAITLDPENAVKHKQDGANGSNDEKGTTLYETNNVHAETVIEPIEWLDGFDKVLAKIQLNDFEAENDMNLLLGDNDDLLNKVLDNESTWNFQVIKTSSANDGMYHCNSNNIVIGDATRSHDEMCSMPDSLLNSNSANINEDNTTNLDIVQSDTTKICSNKSSIQIATTNGDTEDSKAAVDNAGVISNNKDIQQTNTNSFNSTHLEASHDDNRDDNIVKVSDTIQNSELEGETSDKRFKNSKESDSNLDKNKETNPIILHDQYESDDCGYHSSDFEIITEEESKMDGLILNYPQSKTNVTNSENNLKYLRNQGPSSFTQSTSKTRQPYNISTKLSARNPRLSSRELRSVSPGPSSENSRLYSRNLRTKINPASSLLSTGVPGGLTGPNSSISGSSLINPGPSLGNPELSSIKPGPSSINPEQLYRNPALPENVHHIPNGEALVKTESNHHHINGGIVEEDHNYFENFEVPDYNDIVNMFETLPPLPMSEIHFLENKSIQTRVPMLVQYEGLGFDMNLLMQNDSSDEEYRVEAQEVENKILEMYPVDNKYIRRKRRRR